MQAGFPSFCGVLLVHIRLHRPCVSGGIIKISSVILVGKTLPWRSHCVGSVGLVVQWADHLVYTKWVSRVHPVSIQYIGLPEKPVLHFNAVW